MERNIQKNGLINLLVLLVAGVAAFAVARYSNSLAGQVGVVFLGLGVLVAAVSWFQMRLEESERLEKLELEELARSTGASALFETQGSGSVSGAALAGAVRAVLCAGLHGLALPGAGRGRLVVSGAGWRKPDADTAAQRADDGAGPVRCCLPWCCSCSAGSPPPSRGWRTSGCCARAPVTCCWTPLCALAVACGIVGWCSRVPESRPVCGVRACAALLALVAVETLVALVLEIYRPRVKGKVERPLYESRLVGLLGPARRPDHHRRSGAGLPVRVQGFGDLVLPVLRTGPGLAGAAAAGCCWCSPPALSSSSPASRACWSASAARWQAATCWSPGAHLKLPWPIDQVYRYRTEQIQSFVVGSTPDDENGKGARRALDRRAHQGREFPGGEPRTGSAGRRPTRPAANAPRRSACSTVSIPVQYQITNLMDWAYNNEDAAGAAAGPGHARSGALPGRRRHERIHVARAGMEASRSSGRAHPGGRRRTRAGRAHHFGGLQDLHPPVKVAPDYEKVVGAVQSQAGQDPGRPGGRDPDQRPGGGAGGRRWSTRRAPKRQPREIGALAQAGLFTNQIPAFAAAPSVYAQRAYLQTFGRATANARKYVLLTTNTQDVITFDLQDKIREDLLNLSVPPPK